MQAQSLFRNNQDKSVCFLLRRVFGVGSHLANQICDRVGVTSGIKIKELDQRSQLRFIAYLENSYFVDAELVKLIQADINRLVSIRTFRARKLLVEKSSKGSKRARRH